MVQINDLVELLNTLLLSSNDYIVIIDKTTLIDILTCLWDSWDTIEFLYLESQIQHDEIQQNNQHSKPILVKNNQQTAHNQISDATLAVHNQISGVISTKKEDEVFYTSSTFTFQSHHQTLTKSSTTSIELLFDTTRKWTFTFLIIQNLSSSKMLDSFTKFHRHLLCICIRF